MKNNKFYSKTNYYIGLTILCLLFLGCSVYLSIVWSYDNPNNIEYPVRLTLLAIVIFSLLCIVSFAKTLAVYINHREFRNVFGVLPSKIQGTPSDPVINKINILKREAERLKVEADEIFSVLASFKDMLQVENKNLQELLKVWSNNDKLKSGYFGS